jgi:methylmalonyl-CoA mutase
MSQEVKLDENPDLKKDFPVPSFEDWKKQVEKDLGINLQPIYIDNDLKDLSHLNNYPGFENYLRANQTSGYLEHDWEISQEYNQALPEDLNEALRYDLERGLNSINIILDKPTMLGLDADQAKAGEVGKNGLSISGVKKMHILFKDIDLREQPVNISCGFSALPFTLLFASYLREVRRSLMNIKGSITSDPYDYLITHGKLPVSIAHIFDEIKLATEFVIKSNSPIKTIGVSGFTYHHSGANAVQELAYTLATGAEYLYKISGKGLKIDEVAKRMKFNFGVGSFYFMEVAKLRAARMLWSKILEAFEVKEENRKMFIHTKTSGFNQTYFDPYANMLRTTTEAFSAIVGGADSIHTNPFDESFNPSDNFSRRIARNTQIILKEESHLDQVIDPAGGSYFVEKLTDEIANEAWKLFQKIDEDGGMLNAIKSGFAQNEVSKTAEQRRKDFAKRKSVLVGTNMYANPKEKSPELKPVDYQSIYLKRVDYTKKYKFSNGIDERAELINRLTNYSDSLSYDLIDTAVEAFLEGATIGEVATAVRTSSESSAIVQPLQKFRLAEIFEELRIASKNFEVKTGHKPKVFLATMGKLKQFKARADFSRAFFEVGGFEIVYPKGFNSADEAIKSAIESKAKAVVICSTDDTYPELVPPIVKGIKEKSKDTSVILAGYPKDQIEEHKKSGVDDFIFLGSDAPKVLATLLNKIITLN